MKVEWPENLGKPGPATQKYLDELCAGGDHCDEISGAAVVELANSLESMMTTLIDRSRCIIKMGDRNKELEERVEKLFWMLEESWHYACDNHNAGDETAYLVALSTCYDNRDKDVIAK